MSSRLGISFAQVRRFFIFSGIYLTCTMAITTLSMVVTVIVLNLHQVSDKPIPPWVEKIVFLYLARMLCMHRLNTSYVQRSRDRVSCQEVDVSDQHVPASLTVQDAGTTERTATMEMQSGATDSEVIAKIKPQHHSANRETQDFSKDWKILADVLDRLFFCLFLLAILICTIVLFHPQ